MDKQELLKIRDKIISSTTAITRVIVEAAKKPQYAAFREDFQKITVERDKIVDQISRLEQLIPS